MLIQCFKSLVPCIQSMPKETQKDECWIIRLVEDGSPVHTLSGEVKSRMKNGRACASPFCGGVVRDDRAAILLSYHV